MKRMVAYAAANGFDRVAWPNVDQVPEIEQWGMSIDEINGDKDAAKRFGAILERYATEVPRIAKALAKKLGGRIVQSPIAEGVNDVNVVTQFRNRPRSTCVACRWMQMRCRA